MSGRKQHYIPQVLQRAFEAARTGSKCQVLVFRKGRAPYLTATEGSGAERDFYSNPLTDGSGALDDKITEFEGEHLAPMLRALNSTALGAVDAEIASVTVAHLAFRTAHMRSSLATMADAAISQMRTIVEDAEALRQFAGIDSQPSDSPVTRIVRELLSEAGGNDWPEKERSVIERIIAFRVRERFDDVAPQASDTMLIHLGMLEDVTTDAIPKAHARVLSQSLVPESRVQPLRELMWSVISTNKSDRHFILPDCVVVGSSNSSCQFQPYAMLAPNEVSVVVMPLSANQLLVGSVSDIVIDQMEINSQLARCSLEFFVGSRKDEETAQLAEQIGTYAHELHVNLLDEDESNVHEKSSSTPSHVGALKVRVPSGRFGEAAKAALVNISKFSIEPDGADKIESITVPANLRAELQAQVNRLPTEAELQSIALGAVHTVKSGNEWKCRIVLPRDLVDALLSTQDPVRQLAATLAIKFNFGKAYYLACWARQCQGIFDKAFANEWQQLVTKVAFRACGDYFGGMASTRHEYEILPIDDRLREAAKLIALGIEGLTASRQQYFTHRSIDQLVRDSLPCVEVILASVASISGVLEAKNSSIARDSDAGAVLRAAGLWDWSRLFANDLRRHYESRFRWSSDAQLQEICPHVERILWTIGVFVSQVDKGTWIDVQGDQQLANLKRLLSV